MYSNPVPPALHRPTNDHGTPRPMPGVRRESKSKNEGSDSEAGVLCGPVGSLFDTPCPREDSHPPNALVESADWEAISAWIPGVINPSPQEVTEGMGVSDAVFNTYPPYSGPYFGQDLLPITDELVSQTTGRSTFPYSLGQMTNTGADNNPFGLTDEMECQSVPEMTYVDRSSPGPTSAFSIRDGLPSWSGPDPIPSISDHSDRAPFGLLSNPSECISSHRSIESIPGNGEAALEPPVSPLPLPAPSSWRRIPQERYANRKGDRSFLPPQEITFSVNNIRGFRMRNAFCKVFTGLDGRDEPVLGSANGAVSCRLLFPGYPTNTPSNQIAVKNWKKERAPITKSKLAYEVAKRVKQYLDTLAATQMDPSVDTRWKIGQGCMKFEKMYLVSVAWVSTGSIQPEIWVDDS